MSILLQQSSQSDFHVPHRPPKTPFHQSFLFEEVGWKTEVQLGGCKRTGNAALKKQRALLPESESFCYPASDRGGLSLLRLWPHFQGLNLEKHFSEREHGGDLERIFSLSFRFSKWSHTLFQERWVS